MKYPIGIQSFGEIRRDGYVYVDKTALMYKMVSDLMWIFAVFLGGNKNISYFCSVKLRNERICVRLI